jgi:sarcosine oxidase subunit alpha
MTCIAVIECPQRIPCNPCESACPSGAITVGEDITALPRLDAGRCTGCGVCVSRCPGLAIFLVDRDAGPGVAEVTVPHEFLPWPKVGQRVAALDRDGKPVGAATITRVVGAKVGETARVALRVPAAFADVVRAFREEN